MDAWAEYLNCLAAIAASTAEEAQAKTEAAAEMERLLGEARRRIESTRSEVMAVSDLLQRVEDRVDTFCSECGATRLPSQPPADASLDGIRQLSGEAAEWMSEAEPLHQSLLRSRARLTRRVPLEASPAVVVAESTGRRPTGALILVLVLVLVIIIGAVIWLGSTT